jgi:hypothetical protein
MICLISQSPTNTKRRKSSKLITSSQPELKRRGKKRQERKSSSGFLSPKSQRGRSLPPRARMMMRRDG